MTFEPPPPPPPPAGPPPPPPPPSGGFGGAPMGGGMPKNVNTLDWVILGLGGLTLIFSFFDYYTASGSNSFGTSASASASAWHEIFGGGFFAWWGMFFSVVGAAALAMALFSPSTRLPIPARLAAVYGFGIGTLFEILAIFIHPKFYHLSETIGSVHYSASFGHGFSFWVSLIFIIAGLVLSLMRAQQTNTALPGPLNKMPKIG